MTLGIALSGGGLRGAAHIGVLKALTECNIYPDMISGASAGSIIAGMYAAGMSVQEMEKVALGIGNDLMDPDIWGILCLLIRAGLRRPFTLDGIIKGKRMEKLFHRMTKGKKLTEVIIPLAIPSVDINTAKVIMFISTKKGLNDDQDTNYVNDCLISEAIRASISIPVIFKPKMLENMRLVDGGVRDNIPVNVLKAMGCTSIIAVNLGYSGQTRNEIDNIIEIGSQTIDIMAYQITKLKTTQASIILNPHIYDVKLFDFEKIKECIEIGYKMTLSNIDSIKRAINRK